jgi:hypothetical protein
LNVSCCATLSAYPLTAAVLVVSQYTAVSFSQKRYIFEELAGRKMVSASTLALVLVNDCSENTKDDAGVEEETTILGAGGGLATTGSTAGVYGWNLW